jgi:hypothetical protein
LTRDAAAVNITLERSTPTTRQPASASGTALRAAPHPMSSSRAEARNTPAATSISDAFGGDRTNPSTVRGSLHEDPARGSPPVSCVRLSSIAASVVSVVRVRTSSCASHAPESWHQTMASVMVDGPETAQLSPRAEPNTTASSPARALVLATISFALSFAVWGLARRRRVDRVAWSGGRRGWSGIERGPARLSSAARTNAQGRDLIPRLLRDFHWGGGPSGCTRRAQQG